MKNRSKRMIGSIVTAILAFLICVVMCFSLTGCGAEGPMGPQGPKGDKGDPGAQGPTGPGYEQPEDPWTPSPDIEESLVAPTGTKTGYTENKGKFYADYASIEEERLAAREVNIKAAEEGFVLLKNENGALPLSGGQRNVTLLGIRSDNFQMGGGGSGAGKPGQYGIPATSLEEGMEQAGFRVNKKTLELYAKNVDAATVTSGSGWGATKTIVELPISYYTNAVTSTYKSYDDAAIITFSRAGAEGSDNKTSDVPGCEDKTKHSLELSETEQALVRHAKANFEKVIVLLNSANIMEMGELNAKKTADNLGVDAVLWIGHVGNDGAAAVGRILNGSVNPSGRTSDLWSADFTKHPSWSNFGNNGQNGAAYDNKMYYDDNGTVKESGYYWVEYRESIYMGYRYYETVAADKEAAKAGDGEKWYSENVVYPFGYGLSYTDFTWELDNVAKTATVDAAGRTITMRVRVKNTGSVAGKDVVQVYASQPYNKGGIEKASAVLVGFAKTKLLAPGQSDVVTVRFAAQDMASFDWNDANSNDFVGYELEKGDYVISARRNSHDTVCSVTRTVKEDIKCATDLQTGNEINPVFSNDDVYNTAETPTSSLTANLMTRGNMTLPAPATKEERTVSAAYKSLIDAQDTYEVSEDSQDDPWYATGVPNTWKQATAEEVEGRDGGKTATQLIEMAGIDFTEPKIGADGKVVVGTDEGSQKWEAFMNQLSWGEMYDLVTNGQFGRIGLASIGKPYEPDADGPQHNGQNAPDWNDADTVGIGTYWVGPVVQASTWNTALLHEIGRMIGNDSIFNNIPGWYGPGIDTHRSPFGGRNFEYFSEDGLHAGKMAAAVCDGVAQKGVVVYLKHILLNDQETNRDTKRGIFTWATEQTIREIYAKPFELAIKEGHAMGTMGGANRIGAVVGYGNYALHNSLCRDEWGFKGIHTTDAMVMGGYNYAGGNYIIRNGIDVPLGVLDIESAADRKKPWCLEYGAWNENENMIYVKASADAASATVASPTQYFNVRKAAMHLLYVCANSNGIDNGLSDVALVKTVTLGAKDNKGNPAAVKEKLVIDKTNLGTDVFEIFDPAIRTYGDRMGSKTLASKDPLPDGVTLAADGTLTVAPDAQPGTYNISFFIYGDGCIVKTGTLALTVEPAPAE